MIIENFFLIAGVGLGNSEGLTLSRTLTGKLYKKS